MKKTLSISGLSILIAGVLAVFAFAQDTGGMTGGMTGGIMEELTGGG